MAKNKRHSPVREVSEAFKEQLRIGESKHEAKAKEGTSHPEGILSFSTYHNYVNCAARFYRWARAEHGCLTRPKAEIPKKEQYRCKKDKSGTGYDKRAMRRVTENLGHNRVIVIAGSSYLD